LGAAKGTRYARTSSIPENERWYFLEEKFPAYGNLVPRDIATREIFQVCIEGKGVGGENQVYLDLTHIPAETLDANLAPSSKFTKCLSATIASRANAHFSRRPLFDGRALG